MEALLWENASENDNGGAGHLARVQKRATGQVHPYWECCENNSHPTEIKKAGVFWAFGEKNAGDSPQRPHLVIFSYRQSISLPWPRPKSTFSICLHLIPLIPNTFPAVSAFWEILPQAPRVNSGLWISGVNHWPPTKGAHFKNSPPLASVLVMAFSLYGRFFRCLFCSVIELQLLCNYVLPTQAVQSKLRWTPLCPHTSRTQLENRDLFFI